jgi:hypothetical protein
MWNAHHPHPSPSQTTRDHQPHRGLEQRWRREQGARSPPRFRTDREDDRFLHRREQGIREAVLDGQDRCGVDTPGNVGREDQGSGGGDPGILYGYWVRDACAGWECGYEEWTGWEGERSANMTAHSTLGGFEVSLMKPGPLSRACHFSFCRQSNTPLNEKSANSTASNT